MNRTAKEVATAVLGSFITLALIGIWSLASSGGLVRILGGLTENDLSRPKIVQLIKSASSSGMGGTQLYDSGWIELRRNCYSEVREIGFSDLPNGMMAYYKINEDGIESIFPWGINQYGDANQTNGVLLDFDGEGKAYIRLPCGAASGNNVLHLGWYKNRNNSDNNEIANRTDVQFRFMVWK